MILHDADEEKAFTALFDGRFPYDEPSASAIVAQGWTISLNAAFCVLHELCRPAGHVIVEKSRQRDLVSEWASGPDHPLKSPLLQAADALIDGAPLPWPQGVSLMKRVGDYDGQRAALSIISFASDCDTPEGDDALNLADAEIRAKWDAKGV